MSTTKSELLNEIRPHLNSAEALMNYLESAEHLRECDSPEEIVSALAGKARTQLLAVFETLETTL